ESDTVGESVARQDPVVRGWLKHLRNDPLSKNETALFLRRWLSEEEGELPSGIQAACWLDIKRTYLALRPRLRRVYLALQDLAPYGPVAQSLGFVPVPAWVGGLTTAPCSILVRLPSMDGLLDWSLPNWV